MRSGHREIDLAVSAQVAWAAIVGPGLREWYYRMFQRAGFEPHRETERYLIVRKQL